MDCLFCKIINNEIDSKKIYEDDLVIAILDAYPETDAHTLIIPKIHYSDFKKLDSNIFSHILDVATKLEEKYAKVLNYKGITYLWNYKDSQAIKHFHLHMLPDFNKGKTKTNIDVIHEMLKEIKKEVSPF